MNIHEWERDDKTMKRLETKHLPLTEEPNDKLSTKWRVTNDPFDRGEADKVKVELQGEKWSEKLEFTGKLVKIEQ